MFAVSPVASSAVSASASQQVDTPERIESVIAGTLPAPLALDPRSTSTLSTQTADAILSLVQVRSPAPDSVAPVSKAAVSQGKDGFNAALPLLAGDPRPAPGSNGTKAGDPPGSGGRTDKTASTESAASTVESKAIRRVEEAARWDAYLYSVAHIDSSVINAISFYLMCNDVHYRDFKSEHPSMNIHWINVDNKKIVSVWPKITDEWFPPR